VTTFLTDADVRAVFDWPGTPFCLAALRAVPLMVSVMWSVLSHPSLSTSSPPIGFPTVGGSAACHGRGVLGFS